MPDSWRLLTGDCLDALATLEPESVDACVTDPPYGISFMGREWDTFKPHTVEAGPLSDPQVARMLGVGVSSICSIRNGCGALVEPSGTQETHRWPHGAVTKWVQWRRRR